MKVDKTSLLKHLEKFGHLPDAYVGEAGDIVNGITRLIESFRGWIAESKDVQPPNKVVFFLNEYPRLTANKYDFKYSPSMLAEEVSSLDTVAYLIGFGSPNAWVLPEKVQKFSDAKTIAEKYDLEDEVTVVLDFPKAELHIFDGFKSQTEPQILRFFANTIGESKKCCIAELDDFYEASLKSPSCAGDLWNVPSKGQLRKEPELFIQDRLLVHLRAVWKDVGLIKEGGVGRGRFDVLIKFADTDKTSDSVIELKVVKDCSHTGNTTYSENDNKKNLEKGLRQALEYRDETKVPDAILAVYDGCAKKLDSLHDATSHAATKENVRLGWYFLYRSDEAARQSKYSDVVIA